MAEEGDVVIRVLGPVSAIAGGEPITLGGPMQHRLLAILVAAGGDTVSTGSLIEQLWSTKTMPSDANRTLRNLVARLRAALGDDVVTTRSRAGYALGPVDVDADRFEELVKQGWNNPRSLTAVGIWSEAVDLWQGHAFGGYEDVLGVAPRAARLNELRAEATEAWLEARFAAGQRDELMADLNTAVRRHPLRERLRAQQMTLLATLGRQPEALRAFQDYRDALIDIGLEPSEELNDLDARIASGVGVSVAASRTLRGYRISGELGRGEFSVVYRAHQPVVDREVAIKQIRAELADRPSFIAQFDAEAQFVARIEHPHIVPVYDYWREPGSAYLVMRYMRNGSLADQIVNGPMLPERVAEIAIQVGAALDESHRLGITHGDVKPANILLDDQDRAYLSDFGIATDESQPADPSRWLSHGASSYASPEQLSRESIGAPTDVHGLGLTLYEALVGEIPFPDERSAAELLERQLNDPIPLARVMRPELPAGVDTVLQRATAKNPRDRFASAGELAASLAAAVGLDGVETKAIERRNPFKGLRPFTEADAADFVGRERLTDRLLATVGRHRLTMVVGPSGSGKSSVVAAGLVPAVRAGRLVGSGNWFVTSMAPGVDPFTALAEALLRVAVEVPPDMARRLEADPRGFNRLLRRLVPAGRTTLLVIDQFEELYTVVPQEQRQRFLDLMIEATRPADSVIRVVATLRADFFHEPLRSPGLAIAIEESTVAVHPMTSGELERAIIEPARAVGAEFEAGLVARLITDVADQSGALPMLQHLLAELYERKVDSAMTIAAYEKQGGVGGALSQRADEVFDSLTEAEKNSARALLVRLVNIGAGSIDTRRRVRRSEVVHGDDAEVVIDRFGTARLLSFDHDPVSREPTVELAHESLITRWERLGRWLSVDRDRLRVRQLLSEAALNWSRQGCDDADLFRGSRLLTTVEAVGDGSPELTQAERDFLDRSREHEEAEQEAERETSRRLNDLVDRQRVGNRRLRGALSAVGVVAVVALVAGLVAVQQRNRVDNERREAEVASLVAESLRLANDDPILAGLLAVEAFGHDQRAAAPSLFAALAASPGLDRSVSWDAPTGDRACGSLSPGGAVLAGATAAGPIYLVDDDGTQRTVGSEVVCWAAADPTGQYAAGITDRSEVRLWDLETGEVIARRPLERGPSALIWRPDGSALAVLHGAFGSGFQRGDRLDVLGVPDLDLHWPAETFTDRPFVLDWSDDSRLLLIGSEAGGQEPALLSALDAETGAVLSQIVLDLDPAAVDLAADGRTVAIVFKSGLVAIIDLTSGIAELQLDESRFVSRPVRAWIVLDGTVLAVAQLDGTLLLLDPETGEAHFPSVQNTGAALDVDSAGEEIRLVTADGVLQRLEPGQAGATTASVPLPPRAVEYERSTFGRFVFVRPHLNYTIGPSTGGRVFIINAELGIDILDLSQPGAIMRQLPGPRGRVSYTYVGLPGEHIGHLVGDSAYVVYDANGDLVSEKSLGADLEHPSTVFDIAANERGDVALIGREAPPSEGSAISQLPAKGTDHVYLVEGISGDHDRVALPRGVLTTVVRVDNDGAAIVGLADGRIARVGRDRTIEYTTVAEPGIAVRTLDVRVDGTIVAVDAQGTMWLVDKVGVGSITTAATGVEDVRALGWADQVVTTDALGSMRLWDLTSGAQLALLRKGPGNTDAVAVIDDEARRVWVPGDRSLEAQSTDPAEWAAVLCQRTNRTLTPAERATHIPPGLRDEPNSSACRPPGSSDDTETKPLDKETNP